MASHLVGGAVKRMAVHRLDSTTFQRVGRSLLLGAIALMGGLALSSKPSAAAERVRVTLGVLEFPLAIDDLETFANTGEIEGSMRLYARFLDEQARADFRSFLQQELEIDAFTVSQVTYSPMIERSLHNLGSIIRTEAGINGFHAIRAALILAAADPDGLTMLNVIEQFPSSSIRISVPQLLTLRDAFVETAAYRDAAIQAIEGEMEREIAENPSPSTLPMDDLTLPGPYRFSSDSYELRRDRLSSRGEAVERSFRVDFYLPEGLTEPAPVVVISHGLGSGPDAFAYLAEHLASYGFAVVVPQHIGSDASRRQALVEGILSSDVNPVEFIDRPLDIKFVLDELERRSQTDPALQGKLDLQNVGAIGHSFGGYTVLALGGAQLNIDRLRQTCATPLISLNAAPSLQCLASRLPRFNYQLHDERVNAVVALSPITGILFGPEGMGQVQTPTMITGGSLDFIASVITEQIHPFTWLTTPDKYLAVAIPSGHTAADNTREVSGEESNLLTALLTGPNPEVGRAYVRELSLAMMQVHLHDRPEYRAYLTPEYARFVSAVQPIELQMVRSLTPEQLEESFGRTPPIAIVPDPPLSTVRESNNPILAEIAETGILKAAIRTDALPFGYLDAQQQPEGFCVSLLEELTTQLESQLNRPVTLDLSTRSTVENRYDLVRRREAFVECGPNTVREDVDGIAFSTPIFLTGTHLLVESQYRDSVNPLSSLGGVSIGVLQGTTTETLIRDRYPNAQVIPFTGTNGRSEGIQALADGALDAFASDGVLLSAEANRQGLSPSDYVLVPEVPLSCDPYGLILPDNDSQWQQTVNTLLGTPEFRTLWEEWFTADLYPYLLFNLDYCVND